MTANKLITFGQLAKLFPEIANKTLLVWVRHGLIPHSDTKKDGRGIIRLFSANDIVKARQFIDDRLRVRELYRITKG